MLLKVGRIQTLSLKIFTNFNWFLFEVETQLIISKELEYISEEELGGISKELVQ